MFALERQQEIVRLVNESGKGLVKDLAARFSVTEDCIRKDLALLEKRKLLERTYGGAVPVRKNLHHFEVRQRKSSNVDAKQRIAQKAVELVGEGDTVFLDISTSSLELMKEIIRRQIKVTVVTNMVELIAPAGEAALPLICAGGRLNPTGDGFMGAATVAFVSRFKYDVGFFGVVGMDLQTLSAYTYTMEDGDVKASALAACKRAFIVAETAKFRRDGNYKYARLTDFEGILLDAAPDAGLAETARENGLELL